MFEIFKFTREGSKNTDPFENLTFSEKIETIGKLVARLCSEEQLKVGGKTMSFRIRDVIDKSDGSDKGSVSIYWRKK